MEKVGGSSFYTHEKARMDAEAAARNRGWLINHDFGYPLHICRRHAEGSYYNQEPLNEIRKDTATS
jgi:hypothetical protein